MTAPLAYCVRTTLLCVDRQARALISLEPGTEMTYVSEEDSGMVVLRRSGREMLAFAVDLEDRAEAVPATGHSSEKQGRRDAHTFRSANPARWTPKARQAWGRITARNIRSRIDAVDTTGHYRHRGEVRRS